jgi:NADP-dependent 3-hydroxy acid dehydrogenase YdfG
MDANGVLAGRIAFVTGAGLGIGAAIARGYAQAGAVVCCMARTGSEITAIARAIEALTVIPRRPSSIAKRRVRISTSALVAA